MPGDLFSRLRWRPRLEDVTVPTGQNWVVLGASQLPEPTTAVVGSSTALGTIVAHELAFDAHSLAEVAGPLAITPKNLVSVSDGATRLPLSSEGRIIFGLLQSENGSDGHTIAGTTPDRVQVSFVRVNPTGDDLEPVPVEDIEELVVNFSTIERTTKRLVPEEAPILDVAAAAGGGGTGTGGGGGSVQIEDVSPNSPASLTYQDSPNDTVLQSGIVTDLTLDVTIRSVHPLVTLEGPGAVPVNGVLTRSNPNEFYRGTLQITVTGPGNLEAIGVTPDDTQGGIDTFEILAIDVPPNVSSALFSGPYPEGPNETQTELAEDDVFDLVIVANKLFKEVEIDDFGASKPLSIPVSDTLSTTVQIVAADRGATPQALGARVRVRDAVTEAWSPWFLTSSQGAVDGLHVVTLNNFQPTVSFGTPSYPGAQLALKGTETATVPVTYNGVDTALFTVPGTPDQISIDSPLTVEPTKTVHALGTGLVNLLTPNMRVDVVKNSNGRINSAQTVVAIVDAPHVPNVVLPAARLQTGGNDGTSPVDHEIQITSNQPLLIAPTMDEDSGGNRGTFIDAWSGGPLTWSRTLRVDESIPDQRGTFTFENFSTTGLSGIVVTSPGSGLSYEIGGWVARDAVFGPFQTQTTLGVAVTDFSKLQAGAWEASSNQSVKFPIGTAPPQPEGYTILATGSDPTTVVWLDTDRAGTNTGNAALFDIEELP